MDNTIPMIPGPQVVPSSVCFRCEVCCRFPDHNSMLRPYFTADEIQQAIAQGVSPDSFPEHRGSQVNVIPHPTEEGFLCPAFDPATHRCGIYEVRPLDCQLYPFALMWNAQYDRVEFGWDPLCPFLLEQATGNTLPQEEEPPHATRELPATLIEQGRTIATYLESEEVLHTLAAHPRLVTPFQPDVVVLQHLDRLTATLRSSSTYDIR
jgi:uncharacterized protein